MVLPPKFSIPKCPPYKGMKDLLSHVMCFKMAKMPVCFLKKKKDAMFYKIFVSTFKNVAQKYS